MPFSPTFLGWLREAHSVRIFDTGGDSG